MIAPLADSLIKKKENTLTGFFVIFMGTHVKFLINKIGKILDLFLVKLLLMVCFIAVKKLQLVLILFKRFFYLIISLLRDFQ